MKRTVIIYGTGLAVVTGLLKFIEYRYIIRDLTLELYMGIIAVLFTAIGIWMGLKFIGERKKVLVVDGVKNYEIDNELIKHLNISSREYEVLTLIAEGFSNQEIADKLFVSLSTIKTHSSNLFSKLDVKRRTQAIQKAKDLRII